MDKGSPGHTGLHRPHQVTAGGLRQPRATADPLLDMKRFHVIDLEIGLSRAELLQACLIELEGSRGSLLLHPIQERISDLWHCRTLGGGHWNDHGCGALHQLVIAAECGLFVGAKINLLACDLDVPAISRLAIERLGEVGHSEPRIWKNPEATFGSLRDWTGAATPVQSFFTVTSLTNSLTLGCFVNTPCCNSLANKYPRRDSNPRPPV